MNILYFVVPLALCFMGGSIWAFFWAARKGQFDDLDTPAVRLLIDDETAPRYRSGIDAFSSNDDNDCESSIER